VQFVVSPKLVRVFVASLVALVCSGVAVASKSFTVKPAQSWVRTVVPSVAAPTPPDGTSSSNILEDQQTRVSSNSVERYSHSVKRIENTSGLDDLSQLRFYFEPSYQQLTIHFVRIQRAGTTINALNPSEIKMIQQEDELDQQLYNGTMAAVIFVNDLRVGDTVDYAYTITGENPVLGGKFTDRFYLGGSEPIQELLVRLLYPTNRPLSLKNDNTSLEPTRQSIGEETEYLWYTKDTSAISPEDSVPDWFNPYPVVNVSEFQSWGDVVNWALPYYQLVSIKHPELLAKIAEWKNSSEQPERRAVAALRFIQDEIRYLGIELGRYSHQPSAPEKVFARRFGDCKDKSLLLSSVLAAMGIEAAPALVNSQTRSTIDSNQASPFAFDHVIVNAKINGKTFWLDPTVSYQRGGLDQYYDPPFERGLVLRANVNQLEKIPVPLPTAGSLDVVETYERQAPQLPISLTVKSVYRGLEADQMRYRLSTSSLAEWSKSYVNYYSDNTPSIKANGLPVVKDDQETNTLMMEERYQIQELWKDGKHRFIADRISEHLYKPRVSQRTSPLEIPYPLSITQKIVIDLGPGFDFPDFQDVIVDDALRFDYQFAKDGDRLIMQYALKTFRESVPVERVQQHLALIDQAQQFVGFDLESQSGPRRGYAAASSSFAWEWIAWLIFLPGIVFFLIWLVRRMFAKQRVSEFVEKLKTTPGSAPETALNFTSEEQLENALINYSCRCGGRPYDPSSPPKRERSSYDGQRLIGLRLVCPACKLSSDLFVHVQEEKVGEAFTEGAPAS
jgi:hypothetical protein